ncbi:hypothetical protein BCR34DRAFT_37207 [Clohesyomyces aquaticus]|uniref:Uncharacterized protein n=1 Tax=Clohesyomyces aquaticus TaxID=1231657 RepID=A0A1Y2A5V3_9PLEO|nr:hypothetical protein BCR34DRAFT_37207 [Clohesyomyces aquaticus]
MPSMILLGVVALLSIAAAVPYPPPIRCGERAVQVRLPPAFDGGNSSRYWTPYPVGWYFKPWDMVFASNPANLALRNFQYDPTPVDPAQPRGLVNDLGSFQIPGNDTVFTTYGVDTPDPLYPAVLHYSGTGILTGAFSDYSVLAWGCDENKLPYYVNYATFTELTQTPAGIDILSTSVTGMDSKTLAEIKRKLKALGNAEISGMADGLQPMTNDGARDGQPRVDTCDELCKSNVNLLAVLG